jgi:hypothetical protein
MCTCADKVASCLSMKSELDQHAEGFYAAV